MSHGLPDSLRGRDFISHTDLSREELDAVLKLAFEMKQEQRTFRVEGSKNLVMLYFNASLRTRTSFEIGCQQLGIGVVNINPVADNWEFEWRDGVVMDGSAVEHIKDAARVLSRYGNAIGIRTYPPMFNLQEDRRDPLVTALRRHATVPVINLESAMAHPCQGLADLMTLREAFPAGLKGRKVVLTWVPHPQPLTQSVANTFLQVAASTGAEVTLACPKGFELAGEVMTSAREAAKVAGGRVSVSHDRDEALEGAVVVYAKSWVSSEWYGDWSAEQRQRETLGDAWRLTSEAMGMTHRARLMHPLPLRRNVVVDDAVVDGPDCLIYQQAENRLHVQKALLVGLLG